MSSKKASVYIFIMIAVALLQACISSYASENARETVHVLFDMSIDGGAVTFIDRVVSNNRGRILVIEFRSYGGFLSAADKIISLLERNAASCIAWIPRDGYAVSAAAYIALYCDKIYIAPGGVIGGVKPDPYNEKAVEYIKARIRSFLQDKNVTNAIQIVDEIVDEAKHYSSKEAAERGLAHEALSLEEIIEKEGLVLSSREEPSLWDKLISVLSYPLVSSLMLLAGIVLILVEIYTTGFQGYGIAGALLIVFALYSMYLIPIEILHLSLILAGAILLGIEVATPGFGVFGISGITLISIGMALIAITMPQATPSLVYPIAGVLGATAGFFLVIGFSAAKTARIKRKDYQEQLRGMIGYAKTDVDEANPGVVYVLNEDWTAYSIKGKIPSGSKVRVVKVEGLKVYVERVEG